jgi:hypothetical protein
MNYRCPYLDVWVRVHLCKITEQQLWCLLRQTNSSSRRRERISKHMVLEWRKLWSCVLTVPETKNDFAGENQQQFTGLYWTNDLHGLNSQGFGVRVPVETWFVSSPRPPDLFLGPTQSPVQLVMGVQGRGHEADHSSPSSAEVKNGGAISPLPNVFMAYCLIT